jgi:hypothetical protein
MEINDPRVKAEVETQFHRYEAALVANDVTTLDNLFHNDESTIRYGAMENLYGYAEIMAFRRQRPSKGLARKLERTVITTYGDDMATAMTLFYREGTTRIGRQSQTWVRFALGWKIVAAHVSLISDG